MSKPNWRGPLTLAGILAVIGFATIWLEYKHKPAQEAKESEDKKAYHLKGKSVETIRIFDGSHPFLITCLDLAKNLCKVEDQSNWELNIPVHLQADHSNVSSLLSAMNNLNIAETIDLSTEAPEKRAQLLKEYKLDATSRKADGVRQIELKYKGGEIETVYFGENHPLGDNIFALRNSDENKVYLIPLYFKSNFEKNVSYWRDKRLFTTTAGDFVSFDFKSDKLSYSAKKTDGKWILTTPQGPLDGDIENIDNLLTTVSYLNAKEFTSEDKKDQLAKKALTGAKKVVTYTLYKKGSQATDKASAEKAAEKIILEVFSKSKPDVLYAQLSTLDPLVELEANTTARISKTINELRLAKLITSMERFTLNRVEVSGGKTGPTPTVYIHKDASWLRDSDKKAMNAETVQIFLDRISGNKIKDFLSGAAIPNGQNTGVQIALGDEKTPKKREFLFWQVGDKLYAKDMSSKKAEAFLVDASVGEVLPWDKDSFEKAPKVTKTELPKHGHDHHDDGVE